MFNNIFNKINKEKEYLGVPLQFKLVLTDEENTCFEFEGNLDARTTDKAPVFSCYYNKTNAGLMLKKGTKLSSINLRIVSHIKRISQTTIESNDYENISILSHCPVSKNITIFYRKKNIPQKDISVIYGQGSLKFPPITSTQRVFRPKENQIPKLPELPGQLPYGPLTDEEKRRDPLLATLLQKPMPAKESPIVDPKSIQLHFIQPTHYPAPQFASYNDELEKIIFETLFISYPHFRQLNLVNNLYIMCYIDETLIYYGKLFQGLSVDELRQEISSEGNSLNVNLFKKTNSYHFIAPYSEDYCNINKFPQSFLGNQFEIQILYDNQSHNFSDYFSVHPENGYLEKENYISIVEIGVSGVPIEIQQSDSNITVDINSPKNIVHTFDMIFPRFRTKFRGENFLSPIASYNPALHRAHSNLQHKKPLPPIGEKTDLNKS